MKIAVVDDERLWIEKASNAIRYYFNGIDNLKNIQIDTYEDGDCFLNAEKQYEIILLDIEMPEKDGFETAKIYKGLFPDTIVIILTMHNEMCNKGYMVDAFRYIDKNDMYNQIAEALNAAIKKTEKKKRVQVNLVNMGDADIPLGEILFIETDGRKILIHTIDNKYYCTDTMAELEEKLQNFGFYRCHKSYLVNLDLVENFDKTFVYMKNGKNAMISTRKYPEFKRKYIEHKFKYANF